MRTHREVKQKVLTAHSGRRKPMVVFVLPLVVVANASPAPVRPPVRTYRRGELVYLESSSLTDTVRVAVHSKWGGSIVELSYRGRSLVNAFDHGREVQLSLYGSEQRYETCGKRPGSFGWNPVQAGDRFGNDSPVVSESIGTDFIYTKTAPIEWCPDDKGGGPGKPVATDVTMEQWISVTQWNWRTLRVHYRIAYTGSVKHSNAPQELPAVYANSEYNRFIYYDGTRPWLHDTVMKRMLPPPPAEQVLRLAENWITLGDSTGFGLTTFVPEQYGYGAGWYLPGDKGSGTAYYRPLITKSWLPGSTVEGDYYLIPGAYQEARDVVYAIHRGTRVLGRMTPFGFVDNPKRGTTVSGKVPVLGWAIDEDQVSRIEIAIDGRFLGSAKLGIRRPDLPKGVYPGVPSNSGYQFWLDTTKISNGRHTLEVSIFDSHGNRAVYGDIDITVKN